MIVQIQIVSSSRDDDVVAKSWDSWIIITLATGFGNCNLSSFHKVVPKFFIPSIQNRIHFFFFQGGIRGFGVKSILQTLECGVKRMEYSI